MWVRSDQRLNLGFGKYISAVLRSQAADADKHLKQIFLPVSQGLMCQYCCLRREQCSCTVDLVFSISGMGLYARWPTERRHGLRCFVADCSGLSSWFGDSRLLRTVLQFAAHLSREGGLVAAGSQNLFWHDCRNSFSRRATNGVNHTLKNLQESR